MKVAEFSFDLPDDLVAQFPPDERGSSRLLVLERRTGVRHADVRDIARFLKAGDLMVFNDTRVLPARLIGEREPGGGAVQVMLVSRLDDERWEALVHPGQRMRPGRRVRFERGGRTLHGEVLEERFFGRRLVRFWTDDAGTVMDAIEAIGHIPLPPYIKRPDLDLDRDRYQTVFARESGSIAAPTAGLHFTEAILRSLDEDLQLAAGGLVAEQARRNHPGVVEHHQVAGAQVLQQIGKLAVAQLAARTVQHQQATGAPLGQRVTGDQRIGKLEMEVSNTHAGALERPHSLPEMHCSRHASGPLRRRQIPLLVYGFDSTKEERRGPTLRVRIPASLMSPCSTRTPDTPTIKS
jgi:S-adenosylmethionine:tRNA ribosyltransferase-isomerase